MKEAEKILIFKTIQDLYKHMELPVDKIDPCCEFAIYNLGDIHKILPYTSPVFRANYFSFAFVKNSSGRYITENQYFEITPGMIYFTTPGHCTSFEWYDLKDVYMTNLSESFLRENIHTNIFEEFPFLLSETAPPKALSAELFAEFELLYLQILKEYSSGSPYRNKMIGNMFVVILLKIKEHFWKDYNAIDEGNRSSQIVKNFKILLEKHYRDLSTGIVERAFRVQEYANDQHLHPNYLSNVIKSKTGKPIGAWITEKTIAEAKSLLQNSSISIKEIAYRLGFAESAHFSNYFKKHTDLSPVLYRKALNKSTS